LIGSIETNLHSGGLFSTEGHRVFHFPQNPFSIYNYTP
jgi:hypothetical protein